MKLFRICMALMVVGGAASAWAQYGLYGSPDPIQMPQQTPVMQQAAVAQQAPVSQQTSGMVTSNGYVPAPMYAMPPNYAAPRSMQPYSVAQTQAYATQPMQPYVSQPVPAYAVQQMQPARPVATYGPVGTQYGTPSYSTPAYYAAANQTGPTQPINAQPMMAAPSTGPVPQKMAEPMSTVSPQPTPAPGVMNQMLAEQGQSSPGCVGGCGAYAGQCGVYQPYTNQYEQSACGNCGPLSNETSLWYASVSALVMTRDRPNKVYITYETGNLPHNDYPPDEFGWHWGGEVTFGRRFCCGCGCGNDCNGGCNTCCNTGYWALEATYWSLAPMDSSVTHTNPGGTVSTPLVVGYNQFWDGTLPTPAYRNAQDWFDGASEHRLWRTDEVHDVELNLVRGQWCYGADSPWDLGWSMGVRYFRFRESWKFGTLMNGAYWGETGGAYEAYLDDQITNNLIGPQIGFQLGYCICNNCRFFITPKVGIYDNHITNNFNAYLGNGTISRPTPGSGVTGSYPVSSSTDTVAFLTQIDLGLDWKFASHWDAQIGYRVVAASRIGLADAQIPFYVVDIPAIADIDQNGDLIMHGGFASIGYSF
jgi:hypothetical protein